MPTRSPQTRLAHEEPPDLAGSAGQASPAACDLRHGPVYERGSPGAERGMGASSVSHCRPFL